MCGLISDLMICKLRKSMVIHNIECPYWDQVSLDQHEPINLWSEHVGRIINRPFIIYPLTVGAYGSLKLLIQPWICAPGNHHSLVAWSSMKLRNLSGTSVHAQQWESYKMQDILLSFCAYNYTHIRLFMQKVYKKIIYISVWYRHRNYKLYKLNC